MSEINISQFNNINVYYNNEKVILPKDYSDGIENHWNSLLQSGKKFFRGDSYTITKVETNDNRVDIYVQLTDYAHFLYTLHKNTYTEHDCRVIYTSVLIETSDKKFVLGEMNVGTAFPHKLQFIGGGIDKSDINGNLLDLRHNIEKEIFEELGIDIKNKNIVKELRPRFLKSGGDNNFLSAIFKMDLLIDENQFRDMFNNYNQRLISQGEEPEIKSLIFIQADEKSVKAFINVDTREKDSNVIPTLIAASKLKQDKYILDMLDEMRTIGQLGLCFCKDEYDKQRYNRLMELACEGYSSICKEPQNIILERFKKELGYITPKIGVNGIVFDEDYNILLDRRSDDKLWGIPGGWAESGESPETSIKRELFEETGYEVEVENILDIFTRLPGDFGQPHTSYHILFLCKIKGGSLKISSESIEVGFHNINDIKEWHRDHFAMAKKAYSNIERGMK